MLLNEIMNELIKADLKKNRGQLVRKLVKAASKSANPTFKGAPYAPGQAVTDVTAAKPEDMGHFSGMQ